MFRTTKKEKQLDMFTSISGMLKGTAYEQFHNGQAWHNMFREQVVNRIDENLFKTLWVNQSFFRSKVLVSDLVGRYLFQ